MDSYESAVLKAAEQLSFSPLKLEQKICIEEFIKGRDVFVILPTGFGKTVCYACAPLAYDIYHKKPKEEQSILIVISPLTSLIKDQVSNLNKHYISAGYIDAESNCDMREAVLKGRYRIVLMSPEMLMGKWRSLLMNPVYQKQLIGLIIDEAHCVIKWWVWHYNKCQLYT
jgi:ATP-dependent DNA helicase RecQ